VQSEGPSVLQSTLKKEFKGLRDKTMKKMRKKIENLKNNQVQKNPNDGKHVLQYSNYYNSCMTEKKRRKKIEKLNNNQV
jgi:hypothetical protein